MKAIVAVDEHWAIGRNGALLLRVPNDMKRFRELTTGKVVICGRKTLETFPQGAPLPERDNIILSRDLTFRPQGDNVRVAHDLDELHWLLKGVDPEDVFCIGGGQVYELLLPLCDTCLVTRFERVFDADTFFPNLDEDDQWLLADESEEQIYFDTPYTFRTYYRK